MEPSLSSQQEPSRHLLLHNLSVFVAYLAVGILTLLWNQDSRVAAPVWLPAGIALVSVLWRGLGVLPAVYVANVGVNLFIAMVLRDTTLSHAIIFSLILAVTPVVEVLVVRWFAMGTGKHRISLDEVSSVIRMPLAIIAGCLIAVAYGAAVLNLGQFGLATGFVRDFIGWWVGDALGALVLLPIMLPWLQGQRPQLRQYLLVSMPNIVLLAAVLTAFFFVRELEDQKQREHIEELLSVLTNELTQQIDHASLLAQGLAAYVDGSSDVDVAEFNRYAQTMLGGRDQVTALQWLPLVHDRDREQHERMISEATGQEYAIRRRVDTVSVRSEQRDIYLPIAYMKPLEPNIAASGIDVLQLDYREKILRSAIMQARTSISDPVRLMQGMSLLPAYIIAIPVYIGDAHHIAPTQRMQSLRGVAQTVFRFGGLESSLHTSSLDSFLLSVVDMTNPATPVLVYGTEPKVLPGSRQRQFTFGDRHWLVQLSPPSQFGISAAQWQMCGILVAGLLLVALFQVLILSVAGRERTIHQQVYLKTQELLAARDAADRASQAKSEFLSSMSYELRTPLTAVLGFAREIRKAEAFVLTMQSRDALASIERNSELLLGIINDMLDLAGIEAGKTVALRYELITLDTHLRALARQYKPLADEKGLRLLVDADSQITITADKQRVSQIVLNLLSNAIKFTEQGSITLSARAELRNGREGVVISVRDTGSGIAQELLPRLFRKFEQRAAQDTTGMRGTGLGLALVHELTLMHGGEVRVESTPGTGSEFFIWLPRQVQ
jgi:signal transduction histidine kinase/integral membrane sensor domain MASE1